MKRVERKKTIQAPLRRVYNQATQFEQYPRVLPGVKSVHQLDDTHLIWHTQFWVCKTKWQAEILEQIPDEKIVWESLGEQAHKVALHFQAASPTSTTITVVFDFWPQGFFHNLLATTGAVGSRISSALEKFGRFVERRSLPTGAWRGEIRGGAVQGPVPGRNVFG